MIITTNVSIDSVKAIEDIAAKESSPLAPEVARALLADLCQKTGEELDLVKGRVYKTVRREYGTIPLRIEFQLRSFLESDPIDLYTVVAFYEGDDLPTYSYHGVQQPGIDFDAEGDEIEAAIRCTLRDAWQKERLADPYQIGVEVVFGRRSAA